VNTKIARVLLGIVAVVVAVVLLVVLKDDGGRDEASTQARPAVDSGPKAATDVPTIVVENGEPVGGIADLSYEKGDRVRFRVRSDVADEVHVHGYDLMKDVEPGKAVELSFSASIEGIFEVELEELGRQIAELRVDP
jgi:hypothetical protein